MRKSIRYAVCIAVLALLYMQGTYAVTTYRPDVALYQDNGITVYQRAKYVHEKRDWCGGGRWQDPARLEIQYSISHDRRDGLFPQGYENFVDDIIRPALSTHCNTVPQSVELYYFREGDDVYYDAMRFTLGMNEGRRTASLSTTFYNNDHPLNKIKVAARELGSCTGTPFCDFYGGIYLNAIYENNTALLDRLDQQIITEIKSNPYMQAIDAMASAISGNQDADPFELGGFSVLKPLVIKYMALYENIHDSNNASSCLNAGAQRITSRAKTAVVQFQDQYGIDQGSVGGIEFGEIYTINKEFVPICDQLCDAAGSDGSDFFASALQSYKTSLVLNGVDQILDKMDCNSADVKQFERNLINLTERYLQSPTSQRERVQPTQRSAPREHENSRISTTQTRDSSLQDLNATLRAGAQYLDKNRKKEHVVETGSGLQYQILVPGTGAHPTVNDVVTVHEHVALIDGTEIKNTYTYGNREPVSYFPKNALKGVREGVLLLRPGGKIRLAIPPGLAYGTQTIGKIAPGSVLVYEIELIRIN